MKDPSKARLSDIFQDLRYHSRPNFPLQLNKCYLCVASSALNKRAGQQSCVPVLSILHIRLPTAFKDIATFSHSPFNQLDLSCVRLEICYHQSYFNVSILTCEGHARFFKPTLRLGGSTLSVDAVDVISCCFSASACVKRVMDLPVDFKFPVTPRRVARIRYLNIIPEDLESLCRLEGRVTPTHCSVTLFCFRTCFVGLLLS